MTPTSVRERRKRIYRAAMALRKMQDAYDYRGADFGRLKEMREAAAEARAAGQALTLYDIAEIMRVLKL